MKEDPVFCPECQAAGLKSRVYIGGGSSTCMAYSPFYDEDGQFHIHDPNTHSTGMSCSNGHRWSVSGKRSTCPTCGEWSR